MALALAGCGGDDEREAATAYLERANAIQREAVPLFRKANRTYVRFSKRELKDARAERELAVAEDSIRRVRARLAKLAPPDEARDLHEGLLGLYDANADFAHESTLLGGYLPDAGEALRPLGRANRALRRGLTGSEGEPERQAGALRRYGRRLDGILTELEELEPPPILADAHESQTARLEETRDLVKDLGEALERQEAKRVARLLLRFRRLQGSEPGPALTREAVAAYNTRYRELGRLAGRVQQERAELEEALGGRR